MYTFNEIKRESFHEKISSNSSLTCRYKKRKKESAVSPVIGIMLMLIVTVILAAILSGYVGGMSETKSRPPQLVLQTEACRSPNVNVTMMVLSAGDGIPTKDLKILTTWGTNHGNTTIGTKGIYPIGLGPGIKGSEGADHFGNYSLLGGTRMVINNTESRTAFLGKDYEELDNGDPIRIRFIHLPSQSTIYDQQIIVGEC
ncbi:type IV pilin N-terminal domain-containing protein [Methanospirillum hungatei]|uniref:type IV pilin N-terminal domain-containing protein n=1 Tax=Methanospirillum hungatei TaxID=2203 RepID=UPI0026F32F81|nr:type IV pilin N-terminal domain-containing protein [Methanospirillum hungatei]MCA1917674.1 type IV pilin N-terminal domain-containing protein [Methanospirillum hungatei]